MDDKTRKEAYFQVLGAAQHAFLIAKTNENKIEFLWSKLSSAFPEIICPLKNIEAVHSEQARQEMEQLYPLLVLSHTSFVPGEPDLGG